jgi:o-succinylbenzoate synthase
MANRRSPGTLARIWGEVGRAGSVVMNALELWAVELPFRGPVHTARGTHRSRPLVMVRVIVTAEGQPTEGWGECAALADTTFDREDAAGSFATLERLLVPALVESVAAANGVLPRPTHLDDIRRTAPGAPLAFAALEMAVADAHLRSEHASLAGLLGVEANRVAIGAVVGRVASTGLLVARVRALVEEGYSRVKIKIAPGWDLDPLGQVRRAFPELALQADANGSYRRRDGDRLAALDEFGLLCLEQPLDRADLVGHAELAARMDTPICLDESLDAPETVERALDMGACSVVCLKPARLGGLGPALEVIDHCTNVGVPLWMGGMFESGYARGVNTALAALPGFSWPGDLSPARSYLEHDLVPETPLLRVGPARQPAASPPLKGGMGPRPELQSLERFRTRWVRIDAPRP